jgi:hypothetical protein
MFSSSPRCMHPLCIFGTRYPFTVPGFIVAVHVDTVNGKFRSKTRSDCPSPKGDEILPRFAQFDSASAVMFPESMVRIATTLFDVAPPFVESRLTAGTSFSMDSESLRIGSVATSQTTSVDGSDAQDARRLANKAGATITLTPPKILAKIAATSLLEHNKAPESKASKINLFVSHDSIP